MDCRQAREIVSEAFDRGVTAVDGAAEARDHCRSCADCRAFVEGLALLSKTPAPAAPPELVESIIERGRKMAEVGVRPVVARAVVEAPVVTAESGTGSPAGGETAEEAEAETETPWVPVPQFERPATREQRGKWWWVPRAIAGTGAAAAVIVTLLVSFQGFRALRPPAAVTGVTQSAEGGSLANAPAASPSAGATKGSAAPGSSADRALEYAAVPVSGPSYISLQEQAYAFLGTRVPDQPSLEPLTVRVDSAFETTGLAVSYPVWQSKTDPEIVFIRTEEASSTYNAFRRVSRMRAGKPYVLYAAPDLDRFGIWPSLPSRFATPEAGDGSPTFSLAGKDDSGLDVFTPPGSSADEGFAIAPGAMSSDPAAGDPLWTWWVPKR